ncbi:hypothetical protein GCM10010129_18450 [Streptomyces fumigatiscleroticus]|nr:hypothetical protein GCM10010129_18450 [Streptomyces fumigatiscleroticus]
MAGSSSGIVAGLTAAALVTIGVLTYRAQATVPAELAAPHTSGSPTVSTSKAPRDRRNPAALPAGSGTGERVVYSLDDDRVWLVGAGDRILRTYRVAPSTVDPAPGSYTVTSRSGSATGSDGIPVEHVVRFTSMDSVVIGFSAAVDGSTPRPDPGVPTGGIRQSRMDGDALWEFATIGEDVVVIR